MMNTLLDEIWPLIINSDWRVYRGLLAVPKFARCVMKDPIKWRRLLIVKSQFGEADAWFLASRVHREDDLPAYIHPDGEKRWYQHGKIHRDNDLPAITREGWCCWYQYDECHRDGDLPAVIDEKYGQVWYQNGVIHRDGDRPAIVKTNGTLFWCHRGILSTDKTQ